MRRPSLTTDRPPIRAFEAEIRVATTKIRRALSALLEDVQIDISNAMAAARLLGLDKNLTWKIARVVREDDPAVAIQHFPGRSGLDIFLRRLTDQGASAALVKAAREAYVEFNRVVELHAGDRETLEMMMGSVSQDSQRQRAENHRKYAFRGNGAIWGVQARVQTSTHIVAPSEDEDLVDLAIISGLVDLKRLRSDVAWAVATVRCIADDGSARAPGVPEPLDPHGLAPNGVPLMPAFCSRPIPELRAIGGPEETLRHELTEGPIGNTAAVTCVTGWLYRNSAPRFRTDDDRFGENFVSLSTPVEVAYHDVFLHRSLDFAAQPIAALYSQLPGSMAFPHGQRDRGLLPLHETLVQLGTPPDVGMSEVSHYPRLVECGVERLGWALSDFVGFRLKIRYPPIPSAAVVRYPLPPKG